MPPSDSDIRRSDSARAVSMPAQAGDDLQSGDDARSWTDVLRDYWVLTKPEISFLVTISALAGFLIGSTAGLDLWVLSVTLVGVALCAGGVGMLNHVMEHRIDAQMLRTSDRPLPDGRVSPTSARNVGVGMVAVGVGALCPLVNPLTGILAALTAILYLFVYTPLKQKTKYNTLIGTIPGALPALGGYTAATGTLGAGGWSIFAILAFWQMPHFLSLAWMYRKDYARADYAMLPVVEPDGDSTAYQTMFFTALLVGASLTPTLLDITGLIYTIGVVPLGIWFFWTTLAFHWERTGRRARDVLKASIVYIPVLVALLIADWMIPSIL